MVHPHCPGLCCAGNLGNISNSITSLACHCGCRHGSGDGASIKICINMMDLLVVCAQVRSARRAFWILPHGVARTLPPDPCFLMKSGHCGPVFHPSGSTQDLATRSQRNLRPRRQDGQEVVQVISGRTQSAQDAHPSQRHRHTLELDDAPTPRKAKYGI